MTAQENAPQEAQPAATPADRGIPSVAETSGNHMIMGAAVIGLAVIAFVTVLWSGFKKEEPKPLTTPKEQTYRSPGNGAPYFEGKEANAAPMDSLTAQKEQALQKAALQMALEEQKKEEKRLHSPQLLFDDPPSAATASASGAANPADLNTGPISQDGTQNGNARTVEGLMPTAGPAAGLAAGDRGDPNLAFARENADTNTEVAHASQMRNLHTLIAQGAMIPGVLETAIQSDLPGMVRAVVSENIYSFDGTELLIPQSSRLVGQYKSGLVRGQSRVFIIWNRLIRNDGVTINIGSYGTDQLGRTGLEGDVDTHFFERFGSSVMLSMIDTGLQVAANSTKSQVSTTVAVNTGNDFSSAAAIALQNSVNIPPTINIDQGTKINVFVGKDLDFSHVGGNQSTEPQ